MTKNKKYTNKYKWLYLMPKKEIDDLIVLCAKSRKRIMMLEKIVEV